MKNLHFLRNNIKWFTKIAGKIEEETEGGVGGEEGGTTKRKIKLNNLRIIEIIFQ